MLTDILILDCKQTIYGHALIKYITKIKATNAKKDIKSTSTWKARTAITTFNSSVGHLHAPGIFYTVNIGLNNEGKPTIGWRQPLPLPVDFYLPALLSIMKSLPISIDIEMVQAKLSSLAKFPQLLARLLDSHDSEMLEGYLDHYYALKIHNVWKCRRNLESSILHLAHLALPEKLAEMLCRVQMPLIGEITHQRLALNIQNKLLSNPLSDFRDETNIMLHLTRARSKGATLIALPDMMNALRMAPKKLEKAIRRLESNLTIKKIGNQIILATDYFTETSIHEAILNIAKKDYLPFFFSHEIEQCIEQVERLAGVHISKYGKAILSQSLNHRISTLYTDSPRLLLEFLGSLSQTYQVMLGIKPTLILPSPLTCGSELEKQASLLSLRSLHNMAPFHNQLIIALDADTYTKTELLTVLQIADSGTRILFHATSRSHSWPYASKAQSLIARAHPFIDTVDTPLITFRKTIAVYPVTPPEDTQHPRIQREASTRIYSKKSKYYLYRLVIKTGSIILAPSQSLALKLNKKLHRIDTRTSLILVKTQKYSFRLGDRIIFLQPDQSLTYERYPTGILRAAQNDRILIDFNGQLTVISAQVFLASAPTPCYALALEQFKNMRIPKSIVLAPNLSGDDAFLNAAYTRSERVVGVFYGVTRLKVAMIDRLPMDEQTMLDIVPRLI